MHLFGEGYAQLVVQIKQGTAQDVAHAVAGGLVDGCTDDEILPRSGESHVHEVEVFDAAAAVFLPIVGSVDALFGLGRHRDGEEGQAVVRRRRGLHPEQVVVAVLLGVPVAVRDEDGVEGQPLGLVDGEDAHAFDHGGRDTLLVELLIPMLQESFEVGHVAVEKLEDGIEEGIEVGRLSGVAFAVFVEGKEDDDLLHEMIEREVALRKAIALAPLLQLLEHVLLLPFRGMAAEVGFGNTVAVEGDVAQGVDDDLHGRRGFEQESFIGNDGDGLKGFAVLKMANDLVDFLLFAHQNGHALEGHTGLVEAQDLAAQFVLGAESILLRHLVGLLVLFALFVFLRCCAFDFDAHKTAGIARSLRHLVFGIERADVLPCVHFIGMGLKGLEHSGQFDEEVVVAIDDVAAATEVAVELFNLCRFAVLQRRQRRPVAAAPAVDALLHVAHEHATVALSDVFDKKVAEVGPLQRGGVLELIDHDVAKLHTGPFEDKRGFSARHHLVEENGSVGKHEGVVFVVERVHLFVDFVQ